MIPERRRAWASKPLCTSAPIDWPKWIRNIERKRRLAAHRMNGDRHPYWSTYYVIATDASFRLDGLQLPPDELAAALARGWARKTMRSRQQQRVRNHVAILCRVERLLGTGCALKPDDVLRWYTSIACGLSTTRLDECTSARLGGIVRQINSPHLRLCPALQAIARLHHQLLCDPVVPSFNGILTRLLLRYHLGRCGLPPLVFEPLRDAAIIRHERQLLSRMLDLIEQTYEKLLP
jgi:hypothetical protein